MRFCIIGAGAIGGFVAARLALAGNDVTCIARGATLEAIAAHGMRLTRHDGFEARAPTVRATSSYEDAGKFDVVLIAVKAHQLAAVAPHVETLCRDDTVVIPMQNGLPFWYFQRHGGEFDGRSVESVDPGGRIRDAIPARRIVGCVVYLACEQVAPGHIRHVTGERLMLGELDGARTERVAGVSRALAGASFHAPILDDIRAEVWLKLWGNLSFNPISALTGSTLAGICEDPHGRELAAQMMREAQEVAARLGITFRVSLDKRIEGASRVGGHKTSTLQDVEAGRPIEVDALVGAVVEMGALVGVPTPTITAIYRAAKLLDANLRARRGAGVDTV